MFSQESKRYLPARTTAAVAAAPRLTRASLVDIQVTTFEFLSIQGLDGGATGIVISHLDEAETAGTAGFTIGDDGGIDDLAELRKQRGETFISGTIIQVSYVDSELDPSLAAEAVSTSTQWDETEQPGPKPA